MTTLSRSFVLFVVVVLITALVPIFGCPSPGLGQNNLASRVEALEAALAATQAELAAAQAKLVHVSVEQGAINGLNGPHMIVEGCNLHLRSGSGDTEDAGGLTGLGNLIVGYNELPPTVLSHGRAGSHNVVIGMEHEYSSYGGFVAGVSNDVTGAASTVSGGQLNEAGGFSSSVSAGIGNTASGLGSSVSGGATNEATADGASVSGGGLNTASGESSSVSGGFSNEANNDGASVSGGSNNTASGQTASVSGGSGRTATNTDDWAAGTLSEDN